MLSFAILVLIFLFQILFTLLLKNCRVECYELIERTHGLLGVNTPGPSMSAYRELVIPHKPTWVGRSRGRKHTKSCARRPTYLRWPQVFRAMNQDQ